MGVPPRVSSPTLPPLASPPGIRSPAAPAIDFGIRLLETGIQPVSREGPAWTGTTVTIHLDGSTVENPKPDSSGTAWVSHAESMRRDVVPFDVQAHRKGPHTPDIEWTLRGGPAEGQLTHDKPVAVVDLSSRLRLSAWTQGEALWDPSTRLLDRKKYADVEGIDDITLTQTVRMKPLPPPAAPKRNETDEEKKKREEEDKTARDAVADDVDWADNFLTNAAYGDGTKKNQTDEQKAATAAPVRLAFLRDAIQFLHSRRIQVFVGFEIVAEKEGQSKKPKEELDRDKKAADRFKDWLSGKKEDPADFAAHAQKLVAFFDGQGLDIDGISYDIETSLLGEEDRGRMRALYMAVARELRKKGRYLAYATRAFRSYEKNPNDKNDNFLREQPFTLAAAAPDIIARAMSYDIGTKGREDMFKFALTTDKLHPAQFQVGLGTVATTNPITHDDFDRECKDTWQFYRAGVIHWAITKGDDAKQLARHNRALNPHDLSTGRLGQPLQGPLNAERVQVLDDAAQKEKGQQAPAA